MQEIRRNSEAQLCYNDRVAMRRNSFDDDENGNSHKNRHFYSFTGFELRKC